MEIHKRNKLKIQSFFLIIAVEKSDKFLILNQLLQLAKIKNVVLE